MIRQLVGRALQVLGLLVVPLALYYGIELGSMSLELFALMAGAGLFLLGRAIE